MTLATYHKNLVILVADRNMEYAVKGLLGRPKALKIKNISFDTYVHPSHDPGCRTSAVSFLNHLKSQYAHVIVMFDHEGCGCEEQTALELESCLEQNLIQSGWSSAAVVVISPELENWVWSDSPHVDAVMGWQGKQPDLNTWLCAEGFLHAGQNKPSPPKKAMESALRVTQKARSSSLFLQLAEKVSFQRCTDRAFLKFMETLVKWFPQN